MSRVRGQRGCGRELRYALTAASSSGADRFVGQVVQNRYRVVRRIGAGNIGIVYEVEHVRLARRFALKRLLSAALGNPETLGRFHREARAAAGIGHKHICGATDMGTLPDGSPFIVLELLSGTDLRTELRDQIRLPLARALHIATQCCDALAAAHAKGIVHRDLKPDNIFLAKHVEHDDFVKILDFGVAKLLEEASPFTGVQTSTGALIGTPYYMSPEQLLGEKDVDERTDVWAMGVVLYQMLTGKLPYEAPSLAVLSLSVINDPTPSARAVDPEIPEELDTLIAQAMTKDRVRRLPTIAAFGDVLRAIARRERRSFLVPRLAESGENDFTEIERAGDTAGGPVEPAKLPDLASSSLETATTTIRDIVRGSGHAPDERIVLVRAPGREGQTTVIGVVDWSGSRAPRSVSRRVERASFRTRAPGPDSPDAPAPSSLVVAGYALLAALVATVLTLLLTGAIKIH